MNEFDKVRIYGDEILRRKAEDISDFGGELNDLTEHMVEILFAYNGIGLAAPQVGLSSRVVVIDQSLGEEVDDIITLVNPAIEIFPGECTIEEGCLSVPGIWEEVVRPERIVCRYHDLEGNPRELEANGMLARIIQHEVDHLEGILFVDRLSSVKRQLLARRLRELQEPEE